MGCSDYSGRSVVTTTSWPDLLGLPDFEDSMDSKGATSTELLDLLGSKDSEDSTVPKVARSARPLDLPGWKDSKDCWGYLDCTALNWIELPG